jgi:probable nitrogen fixation protein
MERTTPSTGDRFLAELVRLCRVHARRDGEGKSEQELLAPFLQAPAPRGGLTVLGVAAPAGFEPAELFHGAVGVAIERRTGVACQTLLRLHDEGTGRVVLLAGRLVAVDRTLDDVRGFRFGSIEALAAAGERLVAEGVARIERHPEVARS